MKPAEPIVISTIIPTNHAFVTHSREHRPAAFRPKVLITVSGGCAYVNASEDVEVVMIDYDCHEVRKGDEFIEPGTDEERYASLPEEFKGLPDCTVTEY